MPPSPTQPTGERPDENEAYRKSAENLFALVTSPFEGAFSSEGYNARLSLPVSRDSVIHTEARQTDFYFLTGRNVDKERSWNVELGHIPDSKSLGVTSLEIPLSDNRDGFLVMQYTRQGYMLLYRDGSHSTIPYASTTESLENSLDSDGETTHTLLLQENVVKRMLADIGYGLPELFTTPDDLSLYMAESMEKAQNWIVEETAIMRTSDQIQITVTRLTSEVASSKSKNGSVLRGKGTRTNRVESPKSSETSSEIDNRIEAVIEDVKPTSTGRRQLVITFVGEDYIINKPTIVERALHLDTSDTAVANYGNAHYVVTSERKLEATRVLLDQLAVDIIEDIVA